MKGQSSNITKQYGVAMLLLCAVFQFSITSAQTPLPNPDLIESCPYDIIFVLDESGSIVGSSGGGPPISPLVRSGSSGLISALNGTGSRVAVVEFNSTARRAVIGGSISYQTIDASYVTAFNNYINVDGNINPDDDRYDPEDYSCFSNLCYTNWEDAYNKVADINNTEDTADLVIFFTDGNPTAYLDNTGGVILGSSAAIAQQALLDAIGAANVVKLQGSHIFVVGIPNPTLLEPNVQAISDPDRYPAPEPDFLKGDYSVSTSATLSQDLSGLAALLTANTASASASYQLTLSNQCDSFWVELTSTATNATDIYWDFGNGLTSTDSVVTHLFTGEGPFVVMLAANNNNMCGVNDTIYDTLSFTRTLDTISSYFTLDTLPDCDSLLVQLAATSTRDATFHWDFGNGQTAAGNNAAMVYRNPGSYDITLVTTPTSPCYKSDTVIKSVTFTPQFQNALADFDQQLLFKNDCDTFVMAFDNLSSGGTSYLWDFGNGTYSSDTNAIVTFGAGTYDVTLQVNDQRHCYVGDTTSSSLTFTPVIVNPEADFAYDITPGCDKVILTLTNHSTGSDQYTWRINNDIITPDLPFNYYKADTLDIGITAESINNCASDDSMLKTVVIPSPYGYPVADFDFTPTSPRTDEPVSFTNLSQRADTTQYLWEFGDGAISSVIHPEHSYSEPGAYEICLSAKNEHDCPDYLCKDLEIIFVPIVGVPTAFTPNGDGNNDIFAVRGKDILKMHLKVFNRWGELVFESKDPGYGWDGTYKNEPQEIDIYDWLLDATFKNGQSVFKKGNVTLLR